ncbi:MAG: hypothetical protein HXX13_05895 [Bacteroidetes bacterium]|nr:hypothetical protein [Bacteroidota bacterium]
MNIAHLKLILFCLVLTNVFTVHAQSDSALFDKNFRFRDGIYTSPREVLDNNPRYPGCQLMGKYSAESIFGRPTYHYFKHGTDMGEYIDSLFAFVSEGQLLINYRHDFHKMILLGTISTFLVDAFHIDENGDAGIVDKLYFVDFTNGNINKLLPENVEYIFKHDRQFYKSFVSASYMKQKKTLYSFVLKYNALHPIYFRLE